MNYKSESRRNPRAYMGRRRWKNDAGNLESRRFQKDQAHGAMRRDAERVIHAQLEGDLETN